MNGRITEKHFTAKIAEFVETISIRLLLRELCVLGGEYKARKMRSS